MKTGSLGEKNGSYYTGNECAPISVVLFEQNGVWKVVNEAKGGRESLGFSGDAFVSLLPSYTKNVSYGCISTA